MTPFRPELLSRAQEIARVVVRHGGAEVMRQVGFEKEASSEARVESARELARDLERLGPTFVKLAQFFSSRSDVLPPHYRAEFSRLEDNVSPLPFSDLREIVEADLGAPPHELFAQFEEVPIASASIGQVHLATLHSGERVAVKIRRPGVKKLVATDFEILLRLAESFENHSDFGAKISARRLAQQARKTITAELNYELEAANLRTVRANCSPYENIIVPAPFESLCSERVLCMEFIVGEKIPDLEPARFKQFDATQLLDELFACYLNQILIDGVFHADPHPGNVLLTAEDKLALIDLGMVCRVSPGMRREIFSLLLAIAEGKGEEAADYAVMLSQEKSFCDTASFRREISELVVSSHGATLKQINFGEVVLEVGSIAAEQGFEVPSQITLIGKVCTNLERIGRAMDENFDPDAAIRRHSDKIMQRQLLHSLSSREALRHVVEGRNLLEGLPRRLNVLLDDFIKRGFSFNVKAFDERLLLEALQKVANRIAGGLVIASMIISASMMIDMETDTTIFGYPAISVLLFLGALIIGVAMMFNISFRDITPPRNPRL